MSNGSSHTLSQRPLSAQVVRQMPRTRIYSDGTNDFILEPVNESVVKVTHRDQTGYIGINVEWNGTQPVPIPGAPSPIRRSPAA